MRVSTGVDAAPEKPVIPDERLVPSDSSECDRLTDLSETINLYSSASATDNDKSRETDDINMFFKSYLLMNSLLSHRRERILSLIGTYGIIPAASPSMGNLSLFA